MSDSKSDTLEARLVAAYALRATSEQDIQSFKGLLEEFTRELLTSTVTNLLEYLGLDTEVEVEVVKLTKEQQEELRKSGQLEDYLMGRDKLDG